MKTLSPAQLLVLRWFFPHVVESNCGPQQRAPYVRFGPDGGGGDPRTWTSLEKMGLVACSGTRTIHAGNFHYSRLAYVITDAGRAAYLAQRNPKWIPGDESRVHRPAASSDVSDVTDTQIEALQKVAALVPDKEVILLCGKALGHDLSASRGEIALARRACARLVQGKPSC